MTAAPAILAMLAAVSAKVLVVTALGAIAALALRRSSAACRHALWAAVIGSALLIAVTAPLPPYWSVPAGESLAMMDRALQRTAGPVVSGPGAASASGFEERRPAQTSRSWIGTALVLVHAAGVVIFLLRIVAGRMMLRRVAAAGTVIRTGPAAERLAALAGPSRRVRLVETDAFPVPVTWGVFRPVVALPIAARAWPAGRLEAALGHEIAHVRRCDVLTQTAAEICRAILWFHPAVWHAARRLRQEAERACDDAVLATGGAGVDYAEWLLDLARSVSRRGSGTVPDLVAMAERHGLESRLRAILDPATRRASPRALMTSVPAGVLIAAVAVAGLGIAGAASPTADEVTYGEQVPMAPGRERWALKRTFRPRDAREASAFDSLRQAALHEKQHPLDLVRERSLWALSIARDDEVVAPLRERLESADWRVRAYAAWCLGVVDAGGSRAELTAALRDPVWRVRANAASALAALADPASTSDMLSLLDDAAWQVRLAAVEFLTHAGTAEALSAVGALRDDPHPAIRSAALSAAGGPGI